MTTLRLPFFWRRMSWTNRAGYLLATHQAKDFSDACSILAKMRPKKRAAPVQQIQARLPYADS